MSESLAVAPANNSLIEMSFATGGGFEQMQRVARALSESQLVPRIYQKNLPNVLIALESAVRIGCSPLMVMQNLNIIHEKPSFGASFMIATVNACGRFSPLRFIYEGKRNSDEWGCYAVAKAKADAFECKGILVTLGMAKAEGWVDKKGSKWQTMPELMLQYRAATFWTRAYAPELLMGFPTQDEVIDVETSKADETPAVPTPEETAPRTRAKKDKGIGAMKTVTPEPPAPTEEPKAETAAAPAPEPTTSSVNSSSAEPATPAEPAPASASVNTEPSAPVEEAPSAQSEANAALQPRCELRNAVDKGQNIFEVTLTGDFAGIAYWRAAAGQKLPSIGALLDVVLEDKPSARDPSKTVKLLKSFEVVG